MVSVTQKAYFIILRLAQSNYCLPTLYVQQILNASACFTTQYVQRKQQVALSSFSVFSQLELR